MATNRCDAGDRCAHPEDGALKWTNCRTCGKFFHMRCLPRKDAVGLGDTEADDREVLSAFHCPGECTIRAKEAMSRILPELTASLPDVMSSNPNFSGINVNKSIFENLVFYRQYHYGDDRVPATVNELKERLEKGKIPTIGHYRFAVDEMNQRLKEHVTIEGQTSADALQVDLLRLVRQEGTAAAASSPADDVSIPRCSRCNVIPLEELQVCEVGHTICPPCRRNLACCPLCLPQKRRRLKPIERAQQPQKHESQVVDQPEESGILAQDPGEEPIHPVKVKKPRGRPRKRALENPTVSEISKTHEPKNYSCEACGKHYDNSHIWHYHNHMATKHGIPNPMAEQISWRQRAKMAGQVREDNQAVAAGVSHSDPMDDDASAAAPRPAHPSRGAVQTSYQVEGMPGYPDQDHEPLRPLKLARTGQDVSVDAQVRNEFVDILGTPDGDLEASNAPSNVGETLPEQQRPEPPRQSGSHGQPRATRNQERQQQNAAPEIRNNVVSADPEFNDGKEEIPVLRTRDGILVFRGHRPGRNLVLMPDGKHESYSASAAFDPDAASKMPISPNTYVTPVRARGAPGSSSTPFDEEIGNISASQSEQNLNSVTNSAPDDSGHLVMPTPPRGAPRNLSHHGKS